MADIKHKLKKYKYYLSSDPDNDKIALVFNKLAILPVSISLLQDTGIGKVVNSFRKADGEIGQKAKDLVSKWKSLVTEEVISADLNNSGETTVYESNETGDDDGVNDNVDDDGTESGRLEHEEDVNCNNASSRQFPHVSGHENKNEITEISTNKQSDKSSTKKPSDRSSRDTHRSTNSSDKHHSSSDRSSSKSSSGHSSHEKHSSTKSSSLNDKNSSTKSSSGRSSHEHSSEKGNSSRDESSATKSSSSQSSHDKHSSTKSSSSQSSNDKHSSTKSSSSQSSNDKHSSTKSSSSNDKNSSKSSSNQSSHDKNSSTKSSSLNDKHNSSKSGTSRSSLERNTEKQSYSKSDKNSSTNGDKNSLSSVNQSSTKNTREKHSPSPHNTNRSLSSKDASNCEGSDKSSGHSSSNNSEKQSSNAGHHEKSDKSSKHSTSSNKSEHCDKTSKHSSPSTPKFENVDGKSTKHSGSDSHKSRSLKHSVDSDLNKSLHKDDSKSKKQSNVSSEKSSKPDHEKSSRQDHEKSRQDREKTSRQNLEKSRQDHEKSSLHDHEKSSKHSVSSSQKSKDGDRSIESSKHRDSKTKEKHHKVSLGDSQDKSATKGTKDSSSKTLIQDAGMYSGIPSSDEDDSITNYSSKSVTKPHCQNSGFNLFSPDTEEKISKSASKPSSSDKDSRSHKHSKHKHSESSGQVAKSKHHSKHDRPEKSDSKDVSSNFNDFDVGELDLFAVPKSSGSEVEKSSKDRKSKMNDHKSSTKHKEKGSEDESGMSFDDFLSYDIKSSNKRVKVLSKHGDKSGTLHDKFKVTKKTPSEIKMDNPSISTKGDNPSTSSKGSNSCSTSRNESSPMKRPGEDFVVPVPTKQMKITENDILCYLPETQAHYRPWRFNQIDDDKTAKDFDPMNFGKKSNPRTQVYSGKRQICTEMKSLFDICMNVLMDNIDNIDTVGGIPFDILKPVIEKATPVQLYSLEDNNPHFLEDTDYLWELHCKRDFRMSQREEMETWRELYLRKFDEREAKFERLKGKMAATVTKQANQAKKVQLAYVDTVAKPPRDVLRRQKMFGTASVSKYKKPDSGGSSWSRSKLPSRHYDSPERPQKAMKHVAPMMQKTMKMIKKIRR